MGARAAEPASPPAIAPVAAVDQHGPTIKDAYKDHFLIGMAGDLPGNYSDQELGLVKENFNIVTPENCMKPAPVHPSEDTWRFERPDALVNWCADNNIAIHGHTLVWHAQTNNWFFRDGDKAAVTQRMKDHISTLVGRYKGKIRSWDVVNEAINDGGNAQTAQTENLRNSSWLQAMGPEFLTLAFKFAHEADPDAKLYYNDYGIEAGPKHASSMVLLKRLIKDGAPIHGVGIQGHWSTAGIPYAALDKAISDYASLGLKVSITELDVTIRGASGGQFGRGFGGRRFGGGAPPSPQDLKAQADAYARLFSIFIKHKDAIERVTFWGLSDRRTWRFGQHPLIFDSNNQRKPAYAAIVDALLHPNPDRRRRDDWAGYGLDRFNTRATYEETEQLYCGFRPGVPVDACVFCRLRGQLLRETDPFQDQIESCLATPQDLPTGRTVFARAVTAESCQGDVIFVDGPVRTRFTVLPCTEDLDFEHVEIKANGRRAGGLRRQRPGVGMQGTTLGVVIKMPREHHPTLPFPALRVALFWQRALCPRHCGMKHVQMMCQEVRRKPAARLSVRTMEADQ